MDLQSIKPLQERAKELQCLYEVENILTEKKLNHSEAFNEIVKVIPKGWQFPVSCHAIIQYDDRKSFYKESEMTEVFQSSEIIVDNSIVGKISVFYKDLFFEEDAFLAEEQKLLNTIANRIGDFLFYDKLEKAVQMLSEERDNKKEMSILNGNKDEYWKWRLKMAQRFVNKTDYSYYGVDAIYIIGSTKEATAGPASDIDLLVHYTGNEHQKKLFEAWVDGWSFSLDETNKQKTGYRSEDGLIDLHIITDDDIKNKTSFAVMIGNMHNGARLLEKQNSL